MITAALRPVASRVIQKQQKDIATTMRADAMEHEESSNEAQLLWQYVPPLFLGPQVAMIRTFTLKHNNYNDNHNREVDGVVVPQHMLWPGHSTTAEEAARQLHALAPLFAP